MRFAREYQAIGEPHVGFVACQECFAVVVAGDRPHHDEWHNRLSERFRNAARAHRRLLK